MKLSDGVVSSILPTRRSTNEPRRAAAHRVKRRHETEPTRTDYRRRRHPHAGRAACAPHAAGTFRLFAAARLRLHMVVELRRKRGSSIACLATRWCGTTGDLDGLFEPEPPLDPLAWVPARATAMGVIDATPVGLLPELVKEGRVTAFPCLHRTNHGHEV
jgi:hypothetical protein